MGLLECGGKCACSGSLVPVEELDKNIAFVGQMPMEQPDRPR
jgi:hypothetical protein